MIQIEVVYATPEKQHVVPLTCEAPVTIAQAIAQAQLEVDLKTVSVGIWGKEKTLDTPLKQGDRVEIYRPIEIDPKDARFLRVKRARQKDNNPKD